MGFFNDKQVEAFETGRQICSECGAVMEFEDKWEDVLICPECGHSIDSDRYGCESDEAYEALYPTEEEVLGYNEDEDESDEIYDEEFDELSDDQRSPINKLSKGRVLTRALLFFVSGGYDALSL